MEELKNYEKDEIVDSYESIFNDVQRALFVVAHPDDMEMLGGGTVARLINDGKEVRVLTCTNGALGSRENQIDLDKLAEIRKEEQIAGALNLGIDENEVFVLENHDATLVETDNKLIERIVFHMREFRPEIIITHDPETVLRQMPQNKYAINHRDHRAVGGAVINAMMPMARDISFFPEHNQQGLSGVHVNKLLVSEMFTGETVIDISDQIEKKRSALLSHESQLDNDTVDRVLGYGKKDDRYVEKFRFYEMGY